MFVLPIGKDAHEVLPNVWLGNGKAAMDLKFLRENKIQSVFNCTKDLPFHPSIQRRFRVPVDDNLQQSEIRNLELWSFEIVTNIAKEVNAGRPILIHCAAGMQRSAASLAMYLIARYNMKKEEAIGYIRQKRPVAFLPMVNFEKAIAGFEREYNNLLTSQEV